LESTTTTKTHEEVKTPKQKKLSACECRSYRRLSLASLWVRVAPQAELLHHEVQVVFR
jgi:hypothetical protein